MTITDHRRFFAHAFILGFALLTSFGCSQEQGASKESKEATLARADQGAAAGQLDVAEAEYRKLLRTTPQDLALLRRLGLLYVEQQQVALAFPILKQIADAQPEDAEIQLKLGTIYLLQNDAPRAREAALKAVEGESERDQAVVLLADTATNPDLINETRKLIDGIRSSGEDRASYHVARGLLDAKQGNEAQAEKEFITARELDPKLASAHMALGSLYAARKDAKSAAQSFKAAADVSQSRSAAVMRYVEFLIGSGAVPEAKRVLENVNRQFPAYLPPRIQLMKLACNEKADENCTARIQNVLAQAPTDPDALLLSGNLSFAKADYAAALRSYQQAINFNGTRPQILLQYARTLLAAAPRGDSVAASRAINEAEAALTAAVNGDRRLEAAILLLAELKIRKGGAATAIDLLLPLIQLRPQKPDAYFLLARAYLERKNRDEALGVYRRMIELFPASPQPAYLAGALLALQGKKQEARDVFQKTLERDANFGPAIEGLINLDISEGNYAAALARANAQIGRNPARAEWWALRGKVKAAERDFGAAEQDFLKALDLDPQLEPAIDSLAQLYDSTNRRKEAISKLAAFSEKKKTVAVLTMLGNLQEKDKDFSGAAVTYQNLLSIAPSDAAALNNLGGIYSEYLNRPDEALELVKKARALVPNEPRIADTLGWILFKRGDFVSAGQLLTESAAKLPNNAEVQFHSGMALYMLGQQALARDSLQKAATLAEAEGLPFRSEAIRRIGFLDQDFSVATPALQSELQNFLRDFPDDPLAATRQALLQKQAGDVESAIKGYEKVLAKYPAFAPAIRDLALLYSERPRDVAKGFELATRARESFPADAGVTKALAIVTYRRDNFPRALELLQEAASKLPQDAEVQYYLGQTYRQLKQRPGCKEALERAISLNIPQALAEEANKGVVECTEASQ